MSGTTTNRKYSLSTIVLGLTALLILALATANAQVVTTTGVTATQFMSGVTSPEGMIVLSGSATSSITGKPVRHLWVGDQANGLCRTDPEIDAPGPHTLTLSTCTLFVGNAQLKAGVMDYDPVTNFLYVVDRQAHTQGIFRFRFVPSGDSGSGSMNAANIDVLGGLGTCGISGNFPHAAQLGPDGNLYVGFLRSGNIERIINPGQLPNINCGNVQVMGTTPDAKKDLGIGWVGHDLYGGDGFSAWVIHNADQCFTAANNFTACHAINVFASQTAAPSAVVSDQSYPGTPVDPNGATNGKNVYETNGSAVNLIKVLPTLAITQNWASGFNLVSSMVVDASNPVAETLYVAYDQTAGNQLAQGFVYQVNTTPPTLAAPGAPSFSSVVAGNASVSLSWVPASDGQPIDQYLVHVASASPAGAAIPDVTVSAPAGSSVVPTSATVSGLVNGTTYTLTVTAHNSAGFGPASAPSAPVTPLAPTVPSAPQGVNAIAGNASVTFAFSPPASNGGSAITGYTATAFAGATTGPSVSLPGTATGGSISGLTNGTSYTVQVKATNAVGTGPVGVSNAVTPTAASTTTLSMAMSGPASVNQGANATYTITVTNTGTIAATGLSIVDTIPTGATLISASSLNGACTGATCVLANIPAGGSASMSVVLNVTASITNSATITSSDAASQSASASTTVSTAQLSATDIQVGGSAKNGGPTAGATTTDTYTWQIKDNLGTVAATGVVFTVTIPNGLVFQSAGSSLGNCSFGGGVLTCNIGTINGGQQAIVTVNVGVPVAGTFVSTGSATMANPDNNPNNNSFSVTIQAK